MPTILDGHHAHPDILGLLNRHLHGLRGHDDAQSPIGVNVRRGRRLSDDAPVWGRVEGAVVVTVDIGPQHVGHAMRLDPAHVRFHQDICGQVTIRFRHPHFAKHAGHGFAQMTFPNFDREVFRNFKSLEHVISPTLLNRLYSKELARGPLRT